MQHGGPGLASWRHSVASVAVAMIMAAFVVTILNVQWSYCRFICCLWSVYHQVFILISATIWLNGLRRDVAKYLWMNLMLLAVMKYHTTNAERYGNVFHNRLMNSRMPINWAIVWFLSVGQMQFYCEPVFLAQGRHWEWNWIFKAIG